MTQKPNIVFIFSDQQRSDTLACYGNDWIKVPHLNALADESFVFENAYVTQPVCTPARASIMTGLFPHSAGPKVNKMNLPADVLTIAEMISDDYLCGYLGKWHLGDDVVRQHGFDEWISTEDGHRNEYSKREYRTMMSDYHKYLVAAGYEPDDDNAGTKIFSAHARGRLPAEHQMASFLAGEAEKFIGEHSESPFMLYVSTFEPHPPYYGPYDDLYDPDEIPVGPSFLKVSEDDSLLNRERGNYYTQYLEGGNQEDDEYLMGSAAHENDVSSEAGWRRLRARYMANITLVDDMVGRILGAIDRAGVADNTVVIFTSEHGEMAGDHGMLEKRSFFEEAAKVPLLMRVPWLAKEQRKSAGSVSHIDLVPTLLDLSGGDPPPHLQGVSRVPVMKGDEDLSNNSVIIEWNGISDVVDDRNLGNDQINNRI
ncbi:MAG: sulfatase-like hydrolase/transferase, partial [Gammaproteobacteria bacterium]|nr:sulfatase-like hydrolase/transferase [Gammaproteobacteria bacterium]